eukprot:m.181429 g.181429  ORF g.181429 m.181429 type:complete len:345 (+) comp32065_c1_seq1:321-1355(+)
MVLEVHGIHDSPARGEATQHKIANQVINLVNSIRIYLLSLPVVTRMIVAICVTLHVLQLGIGDQVGNALCLHPRKTVAGMQVWRLLSHAFVHSSWLHLLLNMLSLIPFAPKIELHLGSLQFLNVLVQFAVWSSLIYIFVTFIITILSDSSQLDTTCVVGFSGVLFGLMVVYIYKFSVKESIKVFGLFSIPNTLAPWVCLLLFQLLPNVSFLGHLSGIIVGYMFVGNLMKPLLWSRSSVTAMKTKCPWKIMATLPGFVNPPADLLPQRVDAIDDVDLSLSLSDSAVRQRSIPNDNTHNNIAVNNNNFPGIGRQLVSTEKHGADLYADDNKPPLTTSSGDSSDHDV